MPASVMVRASPDRLFEGAGGLVARVAVAAALWARCQAVVLRCAARPFVLAQQSVQLVALLPQSRRLVEASLEELAFHGVHGPRRLGPRRLSLALGRVAHRLDQER